MAGTVTESLAEEWTSFRTMHAASVTVERMEDGSVLVERGSDASVSDDGEAPNDRGLSTPACFCSGRMARDALTCRTMSSSGCDNACKPRTSRKRVRIL
jgi:hypothetical protein